MFSHFGRLLTVFLKFSTMTPDEMLARVTFEGEERVRAAHAHGKGALLFTGHFGFWEINALVHAVALWPMSVLARPLDNPLLHHLLESTRMKTGNSVIYRRGAIRRVLRALESNEAVAVLIDQHIQTADAVYVDFFNRPAATTSALAALALRTGDARRAGLRAAAPGRPIPHGLRARRRSAFGRGSRRDPRVHAALHGRSRDVRPALPGALVVDAPPLARRSEGRHDRRDVPGGVERGRRAVNRLVIRAPNWLGDAVMALPAMGALRAAFPAAHVAVAAIPADRAALRRSDECQRRTA